MHADPDVWSMAVHRFGAAPDSAAGSYLWLMAVHRFEAAAVPAAGSDIWPVTVHIMWCISFEFFRPVGIWSMTVHYSMFLKFLTALEYGR